MKEDVIAEPAEASQQQPDSVVTESPIQSIILSIIAICAVGLIAAFFLSWINVLGVAPSGYQLQASLGKQALLYWLIPILGCLTLVAVVLRQSVRNAAQISGA